MESATLLLRDESHHSVRRRRARQLHTQCNNVLDLDDNIVVAHISTLKTAHVVRDFVVLVREPQKDLAYIEVAL